MKKWINIFLAFAILLALSLACAGTLKDTKIKCPKCGAVFTTKEGEEEFRWMQGR